MLSDPRAGARGHRRGHLAADRPHAGPGRRAEHARREGGLPQLDPGSRFAAGRRVRVHGRQAGPALPGAGAASHRIGAAAARPRHDLAVRHRRGTLRGAVGARLPARLPGPVRAARAVARGAADRGDGHRDRADPRGDRRTVVAERRPPVRGELRPAQHPVPDRAEERAAPPAAPAAADRASGRGRHRLLPVPGVGGEDRRLPLLRGAHRAALPRRARPADPFGEPVAVPARGRADHGGHDRVRDGHRQAGRPLRGAPGPAPVGRGVLPGDRAGRPGRAARHRLARLRAGRRGAAAADDRRLRGRPRAPPPAGGAPGRHARAVRDGRLPAAADAGVLRRDGRGRDVRELRYVPVAPFGLGRHGGGAEAALHRGAAGATRRSRVRGRAAHRHPARQEDAAGALLRARFAVHVRHRR